MRPVKDRLLAPIAGGPASRVHPVVWTALALLVALGAALAAWSGLVLVSVLAWLLSRVIDGLDGLVARSTGRQTDVGGLLDFVGDSIAYAIVPLGIAAAVDDRATWIATAAVIATFYVNAVSLGSVAALLEKRSAGAAQRGEPTSTTLPRGLVEGTETIIVFTLALALPHQASTIWWLTTAAVVVTIVERIVWAVRLLGSTPTSAEPTVGSRS